MRVVGLALVGICVASAAYAQPSVYYPPSANGTITGNVQATLGQFSPSANAPGITIVNPNPPTLSSGPYMSGPLQIQYGPTTSLTLGGKLSAAGYPSGYNGVDVAMTIPAGDTIGQIAGYSSIVDNFTAAPPSGVNGVGGVYNACIAEVSNANCFAGNDVVVDAPNRVSNGNTGIKLYGREIDLRTWNSGTALAEALVLNASFAAQPVNSVAIVCSNPAAGGGWATCLSSQNGDNTAVGLWIGDTAFTQIAGLVSQTININYTDTGSATTQHITVTAIPTSVGAIFQLGGTEQTDLGLVTGYFNCQNTGSRTTACYSEANGPPTTGLWLGDTASTQVASLNSHAIRMNYTDTGSSTTQQAVMQVVSTSNGGVMNITTTNSETVGVKKPAATVATLPTCNATTNGAEYLVSDATAPTWNATLSGGGSVTVGARCISGTGWVAY